MTSITGDDNHQTRNLLEEHNDVSSFSMTILTSWIPSMALKVVVELGVVEIMKREAEANGGYMSPAEITGRLPSTNAEAATMLDRVMRLLASYGALTWRLRTTKEGRVERTYGLVDGGVDVALVEEVKDGVASGGKVFTEVWDKVLRECWYHLKDVVLDGGVPFNKAYGMNLFEYLGLDPIFNKAFNDTMSNLSFIVMNKLLENYDVFKGISTLVDVGGGIGTALNMIICKYPSIKGINFDLPQVINSAPSYPDVQHVSGDMFVSVPKGDAIFMKWISHDWSDEHCLQFLKNVYDALPSHGKVIICDYILPVTPEASNVAKAVFHIDLIMLTLVHGAKERTEAEFEYLAKACGFQGFKIACSAYDVKVMEFLKNI